MRGWKTAGFNPVYLLAAALLFAPRPLVARDYYDPDAITFPLDAPGEPGFLNGYYGLLESGAYAIASDSLESFYIKVTGAPLLYRLGDRLAANLYFSSILINGPVGSDERAANIANFWMNGVQFEYGANLDLRLGAYDLAWSYSRSSLHPLRDAYSNPASDRQILRARRGNLRLGAAALAVAFTAEWDDLYDFWKDPSIAKPRALFVLSPEVRAQRDISGNLALFAVVLPSVVVTRAGGVETDFYGEAGIGKNRGRGVELFLQAYYSRDTEMARDGPREGRYAGLGIRFR